MTPLYFAPMEGLTDVNYRQAHYACFLGVSKYFMPFVSPSASLSYTVRERMDISPLQNAGMPVVPQILCKVPEYFNAMSQAFRDAGYGEVNLNLGCPVGTVTGKGKGSAMLRDLNALRRFLDDIFAAPPLPVSIKTRIGFDDYAHWRELTLLFNDYPLTELIVHPRTRAEAYRGAPHQELLPEMLSLTRHRLVYNGDLFSVAEGRAFLSQHPGVSALMLGRGLAANPALAQELSGGAHVTLDALRAFHDRLYTSYLRSRSEAAVVGRMHLCMHYLSFCFETPDRVRRAIRRATSVSEYNGAVASIFAGCRLSDAPVFHAPD